MSDDAVSERTSQVELFTEYIDILKKVITKCLDEKKREKIMFSLHGV